MIKVKKECEGQWMVWNTLNMEIADIRTTDEMFMGQHFKRYTVVKSGKRIAIGLEHFQTAKSIASKAVQLATV
ncbi:hypothetical protein ACQKFO_21430 [Rossellomorea sp. NPDC071047]|jgi:hypothetical protein|uniref:hypothetical protein n=1 Tax=Rossellomorea sp. NPDC071047 TaxID=3390675 RepID=UPI003D08052D